jgi:hypothetical protein
MVSRRLGKPEFLVQLDQLMPSVSQAQQHFMGMDYARAKAGKPTVTGMDKNQLRDFASTKTRHLPEHHHKVRPTAPYGKAFV